MASLGGLTDLLESSVIQIWSGPANHNLLTPRHYWSMQAHDHRSLESDVLRLGDCGLAAVRRKKADASEVGMYASK